MRKYLSIVLLMAVAVFVFGCNEKGGKGHGAVHWGYSGEEGPEHWGDLSTDFVVCKTGKNQTPIDITAMVEAELPPLVINYQANGGKEVLNNGHAIQVNYDPGSSIKVDGKDFELLQFHFHSPSENTINGKYFPMEAHFVHKDKDGNLAVLALMYEEGAENPELQKAWATMPTEAGSKSQPTATISAKALLPGNTDYYRFNGSLTTPPCSEGVRWLMLKAPSHASTQQIEAFKHVMHHNNNRPVQPTNARVILK
ncbi:hypothetical protein TI03_01255 [Achromatium sp. WMS1]|nr:hypothetical protein TI03_01255 [Achromatium sp. WMS1]